MNSNLQHKTATPLFSTFALGLWRLSSWNLNTDKLLSLINQCLEAGLNTFDHADIYGNYTCEELFGKAIDKKSSLRSNMILVSKCGIKLVSEKRPGHKIKAYDTSKKHIIQSVENSLKALKTDYLDVLLIHRPDPLMDADEIAVAFTYLREKGMVLHFGVSNFLPFQFDLLQSRLGFGLITNQIEASVMTIDAFLNGVLDQCQQFRIKPMAWSPLAGGELFHSHDEKAHKLRILLDEIGKQSGEYSLDQVALAWLLKHPSGIIPVLGIGNFNRITKALEAEKLNLTPEQWYKIWVVSSGAELP